MKPQSFLTFIVQEIRSLYWDLRGRLKKGVKKRAVFKMTKDFGPFFLVLTSVTKLKEQPTRVHKLFLPLLNFLWEQFLAPKRLLKSHFFEEKRQPFQWKETNWSVFLVKLSKTKIKKQFIRVNKVFWQLLWNLQEHFLGTKRLLKTQIFGGQGNLSSEKNYSTVHYRFIQYDKPQGTIYKGPWGILENTVEVKKISFSGPKRLMKIQIFEKKRQPFQWKQVFDHFFPSWRAWNNSRNNL